MPKIDLYNDKRVLVQENVELYEDRDIPEGCCVVLALAVIQNKNGEVLIRKSIDGQGGLWSPIVTHVPAGTASDDTLIEVLKRDYNITLEKDDLVSLGERKGSQYFIDLYYIRKDIDEGTTTFPTNNFQCLKWISLDEVEKFRENNEFRYGQSEFVEKLIKQVRKIYKEGK